MTLPVNTPLPDPRAISQALHSSAADNTPSALSSVELFAADYTANNGNVTSLSPSRNNDTDSADTNKRPALGSPSKSPSRPSRTTKRIQTSPRRRAVATAASAIVNVVTQLTQPPSTTNIEPPRINRDGPSPTSVLDAVFDAPVAPKKKQTNNGNVGLVPKSTFMKWARTEHFSNKQKYTDNEIKRGLNQCRTRMTWHFNQVSNATNRHENVSIDDSTTPVGRVTRSSPVEDYDDWMVDTAAAELTTNDTRRLSIYPLEQLLLCKERTKLMILVKAGEGEKLFPGKNAQLISNSQCLEPFKISGELYYRLKCTISNDSNNAEARGEGLPYTQSMFESAFRERRGDFSVTFDGTVYTKTFNWRDTVDHSHSIKFFGPPLSRTRSFDTAIGNAKDASTLYHRFIMFYREFEGDVISCNALYNTYLNKRLVLTEKALRESIKREADLRVDGDFLRSEDVVDFLTKVDEKFRTSMERVMSEWNDHSTPLVSTPEMKLLIEEAKKVFGPMWLVKSNLRGVIPNTTVDVEKKRNVDREHSVFFMLLSQARICNRRRLKHWALTQNITNIARGVGRAAEMAISYFGNTVSNTTRRRLFGRLTGNDKEGRASGNTLKKKQSRLLSGTRAVILCYDNYQRGVTLQHQRGEHSSSFFKGTHQCAHQVFHFEDDTFDSFHAPFTQHDQAIPSPWGMPVFEYLDFANPSDISSFYIDYSKTESIDDPDCTAETVATPDFSGERVLNYIRLRNVASHIKQLGLAFPSHALNEDDEYFDQCPATFRLDALENFTKRCNSKQAKKLMDAVCSFQHDTVLKWNPNAEEPTLSMYLGLIAIDESASKECGAITLDLLLHAGVLEENDNGGWSLVDDYESRRIYLFGDAKTIENMTKFVRDMQNRHVTYSVANIQSEVFLEALSVVRDFPGDWHTGLNMLKSIYSMYYVGFLDQFQELLGWNRVNDEVSKCYYQASRLVSFVYHELTRFFAHQFISQRPDYEDDEGLSDAAFVVKVAGEFMDFLRSLKDSEDKWISTCGCFIEMSYDFFQFVEAYRVGDAVSVEYGYQKHSPVWQFLGQHKYVDVFFKQQETLYRDSPFSVLQELRMNRFVRRYHASTGRRFVGQDEFLEHGNRFFSEFPMPRSLQSFEEQSNQVGIGLKAKLQSDIWYTTSFEEDATRNNRKNVAPCMTPEKQLCYEIFLLLKTHVEDVTRVKFTKTYITSIKDNISVELRRDVLERSMHQAPPSPADDILKSLHQVYEESIASAGLAVAEEEREEGDEVEVADARSNENTTHGKIGKTGKVTKKTMHKSILKEPWSEGRDEFAKKDVIKIRKEADRRRKKKSDMRKWVLNCIEHERNNLEDIDDFDDDEVLGLPPWQEYTRSVSNNLGLV